MRIEAAFLGDFRISTGFLWDFDGNFQGISGRFTGDLWKVVGFRYGTSGCFQHPRRFPSWEGRLGV